MSELKPVSYNPSSAGFMEGGLVKTKYESGCLRAILAKKNGARTAFPTLFAEIGDQFERLSQEWLETHYPNWQIEREAVLNGPLLGLPEYTFRGRKDFTLTQDNKKIIVECKSMISKSGRLSKIRKAQLDPSQVAQLVSYMIQEQTPTGLMMLGYYETDPDTGNPWCPHAFRDQHLPTKRNFAVYKINITTAGGIEVDGNPFDFNIYQNLEHRNAVVSVLDTKKVALRPLNAGDKYKSPCRFCVFSVVCDAYDKGVFTDTPMTGQEFIDNCKKVASLTKSDNPKIFTPKRRPK